jgi:hypothetical protein
MNLAKSEGTIARIIAGEFPAREEMERLIPLIKPMEDAIKAVRAHLEERIANGEDFDGVKLAEGRKMYDYSSNGDVYRAVRDHLGDRFDGGKWAEEVVSLTKAKVEKYLKDCGGDPALASRLVTERRSKKSLRFG